MKLGENAKQRGFFERDQEFPETLKRTLDGYDQAARKAANAARYAVSIGTLERIREAQWWEAVVCTIERCLQVAVDSEVDFTMPTLPEFAPH